MQSRWLPHAAGLFRRLCRKLAWKTRIAVLTVATYLLYVLAVPQICKIRLRPNISWYDLGLYGAAPSRSYVSVDHRSPKIETIQWSPQCDSSYIFLGERGFLLGHAGARILNAQGDLVWASRSRETILDFKVQRYRDQDYLTYWEGKDTRSHGRGCWYMLDSSYTPRFRISPVGNYAGDFHDFTITENGTALVTIFDTIPADLAPIGGPSAGWLLDGLFQEIDIETGQLVFEWRASQHYPINSSFEHLGRSGRTRNSPFDFFHINSVDKDPRGNYLVSARHTHSVSCIRPDGSLLWTLGGKLNQFRDLPGGSATSFSWQHDARWHGENTLTLLDNALHEWSDPRVPGRGMAIKLDVPALQAALQASYYPPHVLDAQSQGNLQVLPNGNIFIGWGNNAALTEFSPDGTVLCDFHFGASAWFNFGIVTSYRAFRSEWTGRPLTAPDAEVVGDRVYVSWNGATEVADWRLDQCDGGGRDPDGMACAPGRRFPRTGFETEVRIPEDARHNTYFRMLALDSNGTVLGTTVPFHRNAGYAVWAVVAVGVLFCGRLVLGAYSALRRRDRAKEYRSMVSKEDELREPC